MIRLKNAEIKYVTAAIKQNETKNIFYYTDYKNKKTGRCKTTPRLKMIYKFSQKIMPKNFQNRIVDYASLADHLRR